MIKFSVKHFSWIITIVIAVLMIGGGTATMVYGIFHFQWDTPFARTFATWTRLPAAKVGHRDRKSTRLNSSH